jgi:hypothetical protein
VIHSTTRTGRAKTKRASSADVRRKMKFFWSLKIDGSVHPDYAPVCPDTREAIEQEVLLLVRKGVIPPGYRGGQRIAGSIVWIGRHDVHTNHISLSTKV